MVVAVMFFSSSGKLRRRSGMVRARLGIHSHCLNRKPDADVVAGETIGIHSTSVALESRLQQSILTEELELPALAAGLSALARDLELPGAWPASLLSSFSIRLERSSLMPDLSCLKAMVATLASPVLTRKCVGHLSRQQSKPRSFRPYPCFHFHRKREPGKAYFGARSTRQSPRKWPRHGGLASLLPKVTHGVPTKFLEVPCLAAETGRRECKGRQAPTYVFAMGTGAQALRPVLLRGQC